MWMFAITPGIINFVQQFLFFFLIRGMITSRDCVVRCFGATQDNRHHMPEGGVLRGSEALQCAVLWCDRSLNKKTFGRNWWSLVCWRTSTSLLPIKCNNYSLDFCRMNGLPDSFVQAKQLWVPQQPQSWLLKCMKTLTIYYLLPFGLVNVPLTVFLLYHLVLSEICSCPILVQIMCVISCRIIILPSSDLTSVIAMQLLDSSTTTEIFSLGFFRVLGFRPLAWSAEMTWLPCMRTGLIFH